MILSLLQNKEFRDKFITLYCYHIQYTFAPKRTVAILNEMAKKIDNEMKLNDKRWPEPHYKNWKEKSVPMLRNALKNRPQNAYEQLKSSFSLSDKQLASYKKKAVQMHNEKNT